MSWSGDTIRRRDLPLNSPYKNAPMMVPAVPTAAVVQSAKTVIPLKTPLTTNVSMAPHRSAQGPDRARPKKDPACKNWESSVGQLYRTKGEGRTTMNSRSPCTWRYAAARCCW